MGKKQNKASAWNSMREQRQAARQGRVPQTNVLVIDPHEQARAKLQRRLAKRLEAERNRKPSKERQRRLRQIKKKKQETKIMNECFESLKRTQLTNQQMAIFETTGHKETKREKVRRIFATHKAGLTVNDSDLFVSRRTPRLLLNMQQNKNSNTSNTSNTSKIHSIPNNSNASKNNSNASQESNNSNEAAKQPSPTPPNTADEPVHAKEAAEPKEEAADLSQMVWSFGNFDHSQASSSTHSSTARNDDSNLSKTSQTPPKSPKPSEAEQEDEDLDLTAGWKQAKRAQKLEDKRLEARREESRATMQPGAADMPYTLSSLSTGGKKN